MALATQTEQIAPWAAQYVGIPFVSGGRDRSGVDCYGVLRLAFAEQFNVFLPEYVGYEDCHDAPKTADWISARFDGWQEIQADQAQAGDGILLRCKGFPMHVGLVVGQGKMLHAFDNVDTCIESYIGPRWNKRIIGFYRHWAVNQ